MFFELQNGISIVISLENNAVAIVMLLLDLGIGHKSLLIRSREGGGHVQNALSYVFDFSGLWNISKFHIVNC